MNLEEFVKDVLISLDKSVDLARVEMKRDVKFATTQGQRTIEFDIAVSVEESDVKSGKAGIKVLQFAEGGGSLSKENKNSTVSRIKFGINVDILTKDEEQAFNAQNAAYNRENENKWNGI